MSNHSQFFSISDQITACPSSQTITSSKSIPNFEPLLKKFKLINYPTTPFKPSSPIHYFLKQQKSSQLSQSLSKTLQNQNNLNFLRKVRGDGNCFIRAVAFQFISQVNSTKLQKCFPYFDTVLLTSSDKQFIPKNFIQFYDEEFLSYCLKQNWQAQYEKSLKKNQNSHRLALAALFAQNPYLDFITVLYMRAVSILALRKFGQDDETKKFLVHQDEQKLKNYGNLSDGLTVFLLHKILSMEIHIFQLRDELFLKYSNQIRSAKSMKAYFLLYRNHYDILQKQADVNLELQNPELNKNQSYYGNAQSLLVEGQCLVCQKLSLINVETCMCEKCIKLHERALIRFDEKRKIANSNKQIKINSEKILSQKQHKKVQPEVKSEKKIKKTKSSRLFGCFF